MRLTELQPQFTKHIDEQHSNLVESIDEADGIYFLCPVCYQENGGSVGTHSILCWKPSVPQTMKPSPGRWNFEGTGFEDLSLVNGSSSILLCGGCNAHFWIKSGEIILA